MRVPSLATAEVQLSMQKMCKGEAGLTLQLFSASLTFVHAAMAHKAC